MNIPQTNQLSIHRISYKTSILINAILYVYILIMRARNMAPLRKQLKPIRVMSLAIDDGFYNKQYNDRYYDYKCLTTDKDNATASQPVVWANHKLLQGIRDSNASYSKNIIMNGSQRQSNEFIRHGLKRHNKGMVRELVTESLEQISDYTKAEIDDFLLADAYGNHRPGYSYLAASTPEYDAKEFQSIHPKSYLDETMLTIVYAQMHQAAMNNPDKPIIYEYYSANHDVLAELYSFFEKNPALIPRNVTLQLNTYNEFYDDVDNEYIYETIAYKPLKSDNGMIDKNFYNTVKEIHNQLTPLYRNNNKYRKEEEERRKMQEELDKKHAIEKKNLQKNPPLHTLSSKQRIKGKSEVFNKTNGSKSSLPLHQNQKLSEEEDIFGPMNYPSVNKPPQTKKQLLSDMKITSDGLSKTRAPLNDSDIKRRKMAYRRLNLKAPLKAIRSRAYRYKWHKNDQAFKAVEKLHNTLSHSVQTLNLKEQITHHELETFEKEAGRAISEAHNIIKQSTMKKRMYALMPIKSDQSHVTLFKELKKSIQAEVEKAKTALELDDIVQKDSKDTNVNNKG